MKKFIVFCLMLIVTVSLGVTVWYFVRDNEELVINMEPYVYINKDDNLEVDATLKNAKVGNELIITSLNPEVLEEISWSPNPNIKAFEAKRGGAAILEIKVKKGNISPVYIEVAVGDGSKETPFFIDTEEKLLNIGKDTFKASDNYILMQDISLTNSIKPILNDGEFTGTFNGNGYSINDLKIETADGVKNAGLFAKISETGIVTGLTLQNVSVDGQFETAGSIAGINNGTINRCYVLGGTVRSTYQTTDAGSTVGGICGVLKYSNSNVGRVDRCFSNVSVMGTENIGGLVGYNNGAIVINSYVALEDSNVIKTLRNDSNVGGLVGLVSNLEAKTAIVKNCYSLGTVAINDGLTASTIKKGSLIGYNKEISINSSNLLMGLYTDSSSETFANHQYNRTFNENQTAEKINYRGLGVFEKDSDNKVIPAKLISYVSKKLEDKTDKITWDFKDVWLLNATTGYPELNKNGASVPDDVNFIYKPETISNWNDLLNFSNAVKNGTALPYYILTADITISGEFTPIGAVKPFDGILEGNGKTIKNVNIPYSIITSSTVKNYAGLFAKTTSNAVIQNLTVENVTISEGAKFAGSIVAYNEGAIRNCKVTQSVKDNSGYNVIASYAAGGIAGINLGVIDNCKVENQSIAVKGAKETSTRFVGGISGSNGTSNSSQAATIKNSSVVNSSVGDVLDKTGFDSGYDYNFKKNFNNIKYYVGGISGANYYLINSNYVFESDIYANEYSYYGEAAGIVAYTKSDTLIKENFAELSQNRVLGGSITGFIAGGLACEQYGRAEYNQIGCGNESKIDESTGIPVKYKTIIKGAEIAGLSNRLYIGARLFNCFSGSHLLNTQNGTGHSAGMTNVVDYYAYNRWFGEESVYGEFGQIFSICTFENNTYKHSRYDCTMDYRKETQFIRTNRDTGYGNNLVWANTGNVWYDDSGDFVGFYDSRMQNLTRLSSLEEATEDLASVFSNYGFDMSAWTQEVLQYPQLNNVPKISEIDE